MQRPLFLISLFLAPFLFACHRPVTEEATLSFRPPFPQPFSLSIHREQRIQLDTNINVEALHLALTITPTRPPMPLKEHPQQTPDSIYFLRIRFDSIHIGKRFWQIPVNLDSLSRLFSGHTIDATINRQGSVNTTGFSDSLIDSTARVIRQSPYTVNTLIHDFIGTDALKDLLNRVFSTLPAIIVHTGSSWQKNVILTTKAPIKINSLYTCTNQDKDTTQLDILSVLSGQTSEGGRVYLKGEEKGHAKISYATGLPYFYEVNGQTIYTAGIYHITTTERLTATGHPMQ